MSGIVNQTGARSGVIGTTVGSVDLATATFPAGHILQVQTDSGTASVQITTGYTNTSPADIGDLTAVITPSKNNSDFFIIVSGTIYQSTALASMHVGLKRTGANVTDLNNISGDAQGLSVGTRGISGSYESSKPCSFTYRDVNPQGGTGTPASITYLVQGWASSATCYWNVEGALCSINVFEIAQ